MGGNDKLAGAERTDTPLTHAKLPDEAARDRICTDTLSTLFVEAGAGSGKTTALVNRVESLVLQDGVPVDAIAAVTFTERAAAELTDKLRARLEHASIQASTPAEQALADSALDDLDMAAIGTLHSFARRILSAHPIEAGIPPLIEVLDEVGSSIAFEERWTQLRTELLDSAEMAPVLELAFALGITLDHIRSLITKLNSDWDLVEEHVVSSRAPTVPTMPDVRGAIEEARRLAALSSQCTDETDHFYSRLTALADWTDALELAGDDPGNVLPALSSAALLKWHWGSQQRWPGASINDMRTACKEWQQSVAHLVSASVEAALRCLMHWCGTRVLEAARERQADGQLEFHDLLVLARNLLRANPDVRAILQERYPHLLLDEFQDTDPIQIEIAVRIAGGAAATQASWTEVVVPGGSLFVVGDPKQSIYRFRRADIGMYLRAQEMLNSDVRLTTNFRTVEPILSWVNSVFGSLISPVDGMQPAYQALDTHRGTPTVGPAVTVLGADPQPGRVRAAELRRLEANDVAQSIVEALEEGWTTETKSDDGDSPTWRPIAPGDITILVPSRTSLPFLETSLDDAGILYRTESSSLVYHAAEVRDLFAAARAVADPSDAFALVTTLRSPLFGCGDDDLWTWKRAHGAFNLLAPTPDGQSHHPVAVAITYLRRLHDESRWMTPSEILSRLAIDRRMFEVAVSGPRARDSWRRLRFVIDQARAWSESEHGGLRAYLGWAAAQAAEGSRVAESVLPESDSDSVRIMTIHAAKGLEFPMVILSGMTSRPMTGSGVRIFWKHDGYAVALSNALTTDDFLAQVPIDEQMSEYERLRLMYVAATRARDHLVVSLHRSGNTKTNALHLANAAGALSATHLESGSLHATPPATQAPISPPPEHARWLAGTQAAVAASRHRSTLSASGLEGTDPQVDQQDPASVTTPDDVEDGVPAVPDVAEGTAKGARDTELPAWTKGRYGTAIGRAVHGVLQTVDLGTGEGLEDAVRSQCVAEGVVEFSSLVGQLARSALGSPAVRRAAAREHWRESFVGMLQDDGRTLEGFVDLIYREDDGSLRIIDYKTDAAPDAALPSRVAHYAPQLRAYAAILAKATSVPAGPSTLVFARQDAAAERTVEPGPGTGPREATAP